MLEKRETHSCIAGEAFAATRQDIAKMLLYRSAGSCLRRFENGREALEIAMCKSLTIVCRVCVCASGH